MSQPTATHVYILGYSDGIVKVGRTANYGQRFGSLRSEGRRRGAEIVAQWVRPSANAAYTEWFLRLLGRKHLTKAWGDEYFRGDHTAFVEAVVSTLSFWGVEDFRPAPSERPRREPESHGLFSDLYEAAMRDVA